MNGHVFIVMYENYNDYEIKGVFSSKELADDFIDKSVSRSDGYEGIKAFYDIHEKWVDSPDHEFFDLDMAVQKYTDYWKALCQQLYIYITPDIYIQKYGIVSDYFKKLIYSLIEGNPLFKEHFIENQYGGIVYRRDKNDFGIYYKEFYDEAVYKMLNERGYRDIYKTIKTEECTLDEVIEDLIQHCGGK